MGPEALERTLRRVWAIASKEALHIRRDPRTLWMAIGMPVLLIVLFGYGVSFDVDHIPLAVVDQDRSAASRQVERWFLASEEFTLAGRPESVAEAESLLRKGEAAGVLVLPVGLERDLAAGEPVDLQLLVDGSDGTSTQQVLSKADAIGQMSAFRVATRLVRPPLTAEIMTRYNPSGRSSLFIVPGLIAYVLALTCVLLTALSVAREWERGSMEQLFSTPVGRLEIVLGKLLPYLGLGLLETLIVLAAGAWVFGLPIQGLPLVLLAALIFELGMLGQGLLISVVTRNQMVATQAGAFSSMLPSLLLSGFLFPIENMPAILRAISYLVPARWFVALLRGVLLKGHGFGDVVGPLLGLVAFALVMIAASTARFRRRIA